MLYREDSYRKSFEARIVRIEASENNKTYYVTLDRTYFYPESGGQLADAGTIGAAKVIDVQVENDEIIHEIDRALEVNRTYRCEIDFERRFDFMQQHAGQHILSSAFEKLFDAGTVGFHMSSEYTTIDIDKQLTLYDVRAAERLANETVMKNLEIRQHYPDDKTLSNMPLRKPPKVSEGIRIIEVDGFDFSPCGGTHPKFTGEIGQISISSVSKYKQGIRVEFLCGKRSHEAHMKRTEIINRLSSDLSAKEDTLIDAYFTYRGKCDSLQDDLKEMNERLFNYTLSDMEKNIVSKGSYEVSSAVLEKTDAKTARRLAATFVSAPSRICLLGYGEEKPSLIFSASDNVDLDMSALIKRPLEIIGGRGGGNKKTSQGGGTEKGKLITALSEAMKQVG